MPLVWEDDAADPLVAVAAARRLLDAGVEVVIGHFNSECARAAGALYKAAGVPLLLPAATAPDLCQAVDAYRLCASEERQVTVICEYLERYSGRIEEVWTDGSAYGERLAKSLQQRFKNTAQSGAGPSFCALMGSHVAVAGEIQRRAQPGARYLVPDDCMVVEFDGLIAGTGAVTLCPHATPDFGACVRLALAHVAAAAAHDCTVAAYLEQHADFEHRQYRHADYILVQREDLASLATTPRTS